MEEIFSVRILFIIFIIVEAILLVRFKTFLFLSLSPGLSSSFLLGGDGLWVLQQMSDIQVRSCQPVSPFIVLSSILVDLGHVSLSDGVLIQQTPNTRLRLLHPDKLEDSLTK